MKAWKKGAGFLLALVWMLLLAGVGAAEEPDATALTLGEWTEVDLGGSESQWFSFVPDRTSAYVFESTNGDDPDPRATLYVYDGELVQLSSGDDETGMDFSIEQLLEAGEKYFLKVGAYNPEDGAFQIRVSKITFSASAVGKIDRRVEYGEKVTLEVMATADEGEISYQWYENDDEEIPGATGNQYVIESFKQRSTEYHCEVSNNGISKYIWFTVSFDNHIKAEADPKPGDGEWTAIVPVRDGEPAELKVKASCDHGTLRYEWYNSNDGKNVPGSSNAPTCTVTDYEPDSTTYFYCDVYDEYDNFVEVWFAVSSDNHLVAKAKGGRTQKIEVYRDGILEVEASCSFGGLNYQWYLPDEDDEGEEILTPLTGETSSTLKLEKVEKVQEYCCVVKDEYEHEKKVYFMVKLDNHFTAKAYHGTDYNVAPGTDLTLRVIGDCLEGDLHYSWETYIEEEDDFEQVGTGETLVLRDLRNSPSELSCYVTDDFGNSTRIYFSIQISRAAQAATPTQFYLNYGETATMAVERLADSEYPAEDLHYRWEYRYTDQTWFLDVGTEAARQSSYTTWKMNWDMVFRCAVTIPAYDEEYDEWYDEAIDYVYFYVYVDPLTATPSDLSVSMEPEIWEQVVFYGAGEAEASKDVAELTLTNYDALKKQNSGNPAWTAEKTAGTAELTMDASTSGAKLSVGSFPAKTEEARYALKCAWGAGEPWKHSLILQYVDLSGDPPKGIEAAFGDDRWTVKAGDDGDPIVPEQIFRFADGWTPPIQTEITVSLESDTVRWGTDLEKDAEGTIVAKNPGIYPLTVALSFGNMKLTKDYVLYATRADGTLPTSAYQASEGDTLVIPTGTEKIEENAFAGTTAEVLVLPKDCKIIESGAFAGAVNLREIVLPADCSGINAEAFAGCANVKIVVALTEAAKAFAETAFDPELIFMD